MEQAGIVLLYYIVFLSSSEQFTIVLASNTPNVFSSK